MMWKTISGLTLLTFAASSVSAQKSLRYDKGPAGIRDPKEHDTRSIPGKFIVEFNESNNFRRPSGSPAEQFYNSLKSKGIYAKPQLNFTSSLFQGASFEIDETVNPDEVLELEEVKQIWPVVRVPIPKPIIHAQGEAAKEPSWSTHKNTGVLELHAQGVLGEGATVGIVDTGIDYNHPALGGGLGPSFKVTGGRDIVGDTWFPGDPEKPDDDIQDCNGHGTHVSGIVAGVDERFVGVAPKAKLRGYKVFACGGETGDDQLIAAFLKAYEDGVDIINASIGGPSGWASDPWALTADRIVKQGVFIAISAGNSGEVGPWYASSGSTGKDVVSVASLDADELYTIAANAHIGDDNKVIEYLEPTAAGFGEKLTLPVYATNLTTTVPDDACNPLPDNTPDLSGYLVLIRRGTCTFKEKETNAVAFGAKYIWFYTDDRPATIPSVDAPKTKFGMIDAASGALIVNALATEKNVTVEFSTTGIGKPNTQTGGKISTFSMWGPAWQGEMKPEIAAPGAFILSTFPLSNGGYAILSGTSMASPYIAGIAALYYGKHGGRAKLGVNGPIELKNKILTSGAAVQWNDGFITDPSRIAPIAQQGGGYVNAKKVLTYETIVSPGKLELNDTQYYKPSHYINVQNTGKKTVYYTVSHIPGATFYTFDEGFTTPQPFPPLFVDADIYASVKISTPRFNARPGTTNSFKVEIQPPAGLDPKRLPVFGGKIVVSGDNGETLEIPYQGIGGSIKDTNIWAEDWGIPEIYDANGNALAAPATFNLTNGDNPGVLLVNDWGCSEIRIDIVEADWEERHFRYPPVPGKNKFVGSIVSKNGVKFPLRVQPRHNPIDFLGSYSSYEWVGVLAESGEKIKPGKYKINVRALKIFGRPGLASDWQHKTSPVITIV